MFPHRVPVFLEQRAVVRSVQVRAHGGCAGHVVVMISCARERIPGAEYGFLALACLLRQALAPRKKHALFGPPRRPVPTQRGQAHLLRDFFIPPRPSLERTPQRLHILIATGIFQ